MTLLSKQDALGIPERTGKSFALQSWLRFRHLVLIDTLARTGNMHLAAQQMCLSQPAISKMLRDIEEQFGFALFERLPRKLAVTELGQVVVRYAQSTLNDNLAFSRQLDNLRHGGYGYIKIGAIYAATALTLPKAILLMKQKRPLLSIELVEQTSDYLLQMLEHKQLDLVVGRFTESYQQQYFTYQPLASEPFLIAVNPSHPLCTQKDISAKELIDWPWVLYPLNTPLRQMMEHAFGQADIASPVDSIETTSVQTTLHLLQNSTALALLPETVVRPYLTSGSLHALSSTFSINPLGYGILTRKDELLSPAAQLFIDMLEFSANADMQLSSIDNQPL